MEKINSTLFRKETLTENEQFFFRGGTATRDTYESTTVCQTTFYFFEDCNTQTDTTNDYDVLPAENRMPSR